MSLPFTQHYGMPNNISTNQPPRGDCVMEVQFSYAGAVFHTPSATNLVGEFDYVSRDIPQGGRCLHPDVLSLARVLDNLYKTKRVPPTTFGPTRGTQEAEGFLGEVPWGGGNSNTTQVHASALKSEPVATFRATFRPIEIVPSVCTVDQGQGDGPVRLPTCEQDPYVLLGIERATQFPKKAMIDILGEQFYENADGVWLSGPQCVNEIKTNTTAANASRPEGSNARYSYLNIDGVANTVVSVAFPPR